MLLWLFYLRKLINRQTKQLREDFEKLKKAESSLNKVEKQYRILFEETKDIIYISTPGGRFLDINPAGIQTFGYASKEEMLNLDMEKHIYWNPEDRCRIQAIVEEQGFVRDFEIERARRATGLS